MGVTESPETNDQQKSLRLLDTMIKVHHFLVKLPVGGEGRGGEGRGGEGREGGGEGKGKGRGRGREGEGEGVCEHSAH